VEDRQDYQSYEARDGPAANGRDGNGLQLSDAGVTPQTPVHARCVEDQQAKRNGEQKVKADEP
jgi:hypothetical protein